MTTVWDQELTVLGASDDGQWVQVKVGDNTGYIPADSVILDVKYEEAVSVEEEQKKAAEEAARLKAEQERKLRPKKLRQRQRKQKLRRLKQIRHRILHHIQM